jgi:hypothetical protein
MEANIAQVETIVELVNAIETCIPLSFAKESEGNQVKSFEKINQLVVQQNTKISFREMIEYLKDNDSKKLEIFADYFKRAYVIIKDKALKSNYYLDNMLMEISRNYFIQTI